MLDSNCLVVVVRNWVNLQPEHRSPEHGSSRIERARTITVTDSRRLGWLAWLAFLTLAFSLGYGLFAWTQGPVLLARHGTFFTAPITTHSTVRMAQAQRLGERTAAGLQPNDRSRSELRRLLLADTNEAVSEETAAQSFEDADAKTFQAELAWYAAYGLARGEGRASEELALAAVMGFAPASQRFQQFSAAEQVQALQRLLQQQDLDQDPDAWRASRVVGWLGGYGAWADRPYPSLEGETNPPPLLLAAERLDEASSREVAAACLLKYRGREFPGTLERALYQWGPAAVEPLGEELAEALAADSHFSQRVALCRAIRRLGPTATDLAPWLLRAIAQERVNLALREALQAIVASEPLDRVAAADAIRAANDPDRWSETPYNFDTINRWCVEALEAIGDPLVLELLVEELGGKRPNRVGILVPAIDLPDSWRLVRKLGNLRAAGQPAAAILVRGLQSVATEVRIESALALHRVGVDSPESVPRLLASLDRRQNTLDDIGLALLALTEIGWPADQPPEVLLELLRRGPSVEIRQLAAELLQRGFPETLAVTEALLAAALAEPDVRTRQVILERLEQRLATQYAENLQQTSLGDAIEWLRQHGGRPPAAWTGPQALQVVLARRAIVEVPDAGAVAVAKWLAADPEFPALAGELFDGLGDGRRAALPVLQRALESTDPQIVSGAMARLRAMGPLAAAAFPAVSRLDHPERAATLRVLDPVAYVASSRRDAEWVLLWSLPLVGIVLVGLTLRAARRGTEVIST